ncbi:MAG: hypothetical protein LKF33_06615 [Prevotella sp.]|nr:hypothetical protein [Prevotella sp.]
MLNLLKAERMDRRNAQIFLSDGLTMWEIVYYAIDNRLLRSNQWFFMR